jgi:hypothetical protein
VKSTHNKHKGEYFHQTKETIFFYVRMINKRLKKKEQTLQLSYSLLEFKMVLKINNFMKKKKLLFFSKQIVFSVQRSIIYNNKIKITWPLKKDGKGIR